MTKVNHKQDKKLPGKVTFTRRQDGGAGEAMFITIEDGLSGNRITEVKMELVEFMRCLTGLAYAEGEITWMPTLKSVRTYGKKRIIDHWYCDKVTGKEQQKAIVENDFHNTNIESEWELFDDGTRTQQRDGKHRYTVVQYIEPSELIDESQ